MAIIAVSHRYTMKSAYGDSSNGMDLVISEGAGIKLGLEKCIEVGSIQRIYVKRCIFGL